jgi:hypothetical protein
MTFNVSSTRFIYATVINIFSLMLFQFLQLFQPTPSITMAVHSAFVVAAMVLSMVSCYMQEKYERDNFVHELVLDDEIDKTDALLTVPIFAIHLSPFYHPFISHFINHFISHFVIHFVIHSSILSSILSFYHFTNYYL